MADISKKTTPGPTPAAMAPKTKAPPDKPKPKPKPNAKGDDQPKHRPKKPKAKQLRPLYTYPGTMGAFGTNPDSVYDRFALEVAGEPTRTVRFPSYFGEELRALAQPGHEVTVLGFVPTTPTGDEHLHLARLDAAGTAAQPGAPDAVTVAGTIEALRHDSQGHLHGLRLAGEDTELRLPPPVGQQLAARLVPGATLIASGPQRALRPGEVAAHPAPVQVELLLLGEDAFLLH